MRQRESSKEMDRWKNKMILDIIFMLLLEVIQVFQVVKQLENM